MQKIHTIIALCLFIAVVQLTAGPVEDLKEARAKLAKGKEDVTKGKQSVMDSYGKLKNDVVGKMTTAQTDTQATHDDINNKRSLITDVINTHLPALIGTASGLTLIFPPFAALVGGAADLYVKLKPFPGALEAIGNTLQAIISTLANVSSTIQTANEKLNPQAPSKPVVYVKFEAAEKRFDDALAKIDQIIPKLEKIKGTLGTF